jgi:hypothetical protein
MRLARRAGSPLIVATHKKSLLGFSLSRDFFATGRESRNAIGAPSYFTALTM